MVVVVVVERAEKEGRVVTASLGRATSVANSAIDGAVAQINTC